MVEDMRVFLENRKNFDVTELARYRGKWIAWSADGKHVIASAEDEESLEELIREARIDPEQCVISAIPQEDTVIGGTRSS